MKMMTIFAVVLLGMTAATVAVFSADPAGAGGETGGAVVALPKSLGDLYPPNSPAPRLLLAMLDLSKSLSGMVCDVLEDDQANARAGFEAFKASYLAVSDLVPEWKGDYPLQPVEELGAALAAGDPSKIMPAAEKVGAVCHRCHIAAMAPVQQMYRWDRFGDITLTDPLSGQELSFAQMKLMMETNMAGIGVDLQQGQRENAVAQFGGFKARFSAMAQTCMICHDTERSYYVDSSVTELISRVEQELSRPEVDGGAIGGLLQTIGQESCSKCHLVHIPAAYAQQNLGGPRH